MKLEHYEMLEGAIKEAKDQGFSIGNVNRLEKVLALVQVLIEQLKPHLYDENGSPRRVQFWHFRRIAMIMECIYQFILALRALYL